MDDTLFVKGLIKAMNEHLDWGSVINHLRALAGLPPGKALPKFQCRGDVASHSINAELTPAQHRQLKQHFKHCTLCQERLREMQYCRDL